MNLDTFSDRTPAPVENSIPEGLDFGVQMPDGYCEADPSKRVQMLRVRLAGLRQTGLSSAEQAEARKAISKEMGKVREAVKNIR